MIIHNLWDVANVWNRKAAVLPLGCKAFVQFYKKMPRVCDCVISCDSTSCRIFKGDKAKRVCLQAVWWNNYLGVDSQTSHDVPFSCAINQPLLVHHWRVHQCLLTSRFISPSIPWRVSAPGGKIRKQLLKDHNIRNISPIFAIESSTFDIFAFQKALHTIYFKLFWIWWKVLDTIILWQMWVPAMSKHMQPLKWD